MDRLTAVFVEGMGAAAATSGVLTQLQGRIFGLLYLSERPVSLDQITLELQQSKGNVSVNVRGLLDWQLVRLVQVQGSRRDHYEAATDFWRVMQEIVERRFRWNLRQVVAAADEATHELESASARTTDARRHAAFIAARIGTVHDFFAAMDAGLSGLSRGEAFPPLPLGREVVRVRVEGSASPGARQTRKGGRR